PDPAHDRRNAHHSGRAGGGDAARTVPPQASSRANKRLRSHTRTALDRLVVRSSSMRATSWASGMPSSFAAAWRSSQNSDSRLRLVRCPAMVTDRFFMPCWLLLEDVRMQGDL